MSVNGRWDLIRRLKFERNNRNNIHGATVKK